MIVDEYKACELVHMFQASDAIVVCRAIAGSRTLAAVCRWTFGVASILVKLPAASRGECRS